MHSQQHDIVHCILRTNRVVAVAQQVFTHAMNHDGDENSNSLMPHFPASGSQRSIISQAVLQIACSLQLFATIVWVAGDSGVATRPHCIMGGLRVCGDRRISGPSGQVQVPERQLVPGPMGRQQGPQLSVSREKLQSLVAGSS